MTARRQSFGIAALALAMAAPAFAQDAPVAGRVKVASGDAYIVRQNASIPAQVGQVVYEADGLKTGANGRLGVTMKDDTRVSIGPSSEVRLEQYAYAPTQGRLAFALRVVQGIAAYVSGRIAKMAPDAVRLETPAAIVGVRGTSVAIRADLE